MKVLYDLINARTTQGWTKPVNMENFKEYAHYWCQCAVEIANEFDAARLPETAKAVRKIMREQENRL